MVQSPSGIFFFPSGVTSTYGPVSSKKFYAQVDFLKLACHDGQVPEKIAVQIKSYGCDDL